jgi:hypothetical protein
MRKDACRAEGMQNSRQESSEMHQHSRMLEKYLSAMQPKGHSARPVLNVVFQSASGDASA